MTLAEAKLHLRVDGNDEDDLIEALIAASTEYAEQYTRRKFITQTWAMYLDCFPDCPIYLPYSPVQSIASIKYLDEDGAEQTLASSVYTIDQSQTSPSRLTLKNDQDWPETLDQVNAVTINFICGWGDAATDVPKSLIAACKLMLGNLFENRESAVIGTIASELPLATKSLLNMHRIIEAPVSP